MKQLIVMIATIILGIAVAVIIMGFRTTATSLSEGVNDKVTGTFVTELP